MNDNELILLLKQEPAAGIGRALALYGPAVKWIASKILGMDQRQDVEECVAETFVKLWRGIDRYDENSGVPLSSYINGIARHTAQDFRRSSLRRGGAVSLESLAPDSEELGIEVDFADQLARKTNARIVREAVAAMPPPDDEIFVSRYFLSLRVREIAARLGLSEKTVENRLYRGKTALREALIERGIII